MPTEPVDLLAVSQEAAENLHDAAAARNVTVSVTGQPAVLPGVRRLIYEIVYNLCDNAIAYNPANGSVTVTVENTAFGPRITVADTGIGLAEEECGRVFQRFYRSPSASEAEGVGIGLYLARQIAAGQGGYLKVSSRPGEGSTFSLFLPRAEERT